jgi:hypothetical protein
MVRAFHLMRNSEFGLRNSESKANADSGRESGTFQRNYSLRLLFRLMTSSGSQRQSFKPQTARIIQIIRANPVSGRLVPIPLMSGALSKKMQPTTIQQPIWRGYRFGSGFRFILQFA